MGYGPWAIIAGRSSTALVMFQLFRPYMPRLHLRLAEVRSMVSFGLYATGSRLLQLLHQRGLPGGRQGLRAAAVGIYTVAFRIVADPVKTLVVVNQVAYPAFAKLQDEPERLKTYLFTMARGPGDHRHGPRPVCVFIDDGLMVAGYDQWLDAVPLVRIFAISGLMLCVAPHPAAAQRRGPGAAQHGLLGPRGGGRADGLLHRIALRPRRRRLGLGGDLPGLGHGPLHLGARQLGLSVPCFALRALGGLVVFVPVAALAIGLKVALVTWTTLTLWIIVIGALLTLALGVRLTLWREREASGWCSARASAPTEALPGVT